MLASQPLIWWHFSDIHWNVRSSTERRVLLNTLMDDLKNRLAEFGSPDFVVFSGDITYSGEKDQYLASEKDFFTPIRDLLDGKDCPFFFVPGNHDVRRAISRTVNPELINSINSTRSLNDFLDNEDYVQMVQKPFSEFDSFLSRVSPDIEHGVLGWWKEVCIKEKSILIIGLNSSWASSYHKTSDGIVKDQRHLLLGESQLLRLTESSSQESLTIVIAHHPLNWLNGFCETQNRQLLHRHADFVLFGHTHALHDLSLSLGSAGATAFIPAPAIYDRASTDTVEYARGYNIVQFDVDTRQGAAHYYKYSSAYATKFDSFVELYPTPGQNKFSIDLPKKESQPSSGEKNIFQSFSDVLAAFPPLSSLNLFLESAIDIASLESHTVEYFEALVIDLVRESNLIDQDLDNIFWESVILSRALLFCDLVQINSSGAKPYLHRNSVDLLCSHLSEANKRNGLTLQLAVEEYRLIYALPFDSCSFINGALSSISEPYRRLFALPWALSRLLFYLDYPELIPRALRSEGCISDLFALGKPEQLAIINYSFDVKRGILSLDLRISDKNGFLAVTLLKHYFDGVLRRIADFWRQSQRVLPPITLLLEFPRWQNKRVDAFELTVETTPIVKLLMGRAMYKDARHVWFRELLQNALDANSARRALDGESYSSRLEIVLHDSTTCTIRDNGIGMSQQHILMYLTRLGRSIWNSEELTEGKQLSRDTALRAIGKFGIGFAAVFQDAERVIVRTRFFRDVGELGWVIDFASVEKPFLLEAIDSPVGTEVEIHLRDEKDNVLSPKSFVELINEFFIYIDENISITPDPKIARNLSEVLLIDAAKHSRILSQEITTIEHVGSYTFRLKCLFGFDFRQVEKHENSPNSYLLVSNSGVRVFEQKSLFLKPGKKYIFMDESDRGTKYEDTREYGIKNYWIIVDFEKGASPILPSRLEIDIDSELSKQLLDIVHNKFSIALRSAASEVVSRNLDPKQHRKALLGVLTHSTENYDRNRPRSHKDYDIFCNVKSIQETAIDIYQQHCHIFLQSANGEGRYISVQNLRKEIPGVFVTENVIKSPLFKVYAKAMEINEWVVVDGNREYALFSKAIESLEWKGFAVERDIYAERMRVFAEDRNSPLVDFVRGDYAVISDQIFDDEAFIVLPSNLPNSLKRGEAAGYTRRSVIGHCPPRVLINPMHPLYKSLEHFLLQATSEANTKPRELKLLLDSLSDGVIENDRVTVARERWRTIQRELRELLDGNLPEIDYSSLVIRRN
jgi:predicted phosphodiesterase